MPDSSSATAGGQVNGYNRLARFSVPDAHCGKRRRPEHLRTDSIYAQMVSVSIGLALDMVSFNRLLWLSVDLPNFDRFSGERQCRETICSIQQTLVHAIPVLSQDVGDRLRIGRCAQMQGDGVSRNCS